LPDFTRRQLLKSGLAASATSLLPATPLPAQPTPAAPTQNPALPAALPRERLRLDRGWRFRLGDACDPAKDLRFGATARERVFAKSGSIAQATPSLDDSTWASVDLPHDWAEDLPFIAVPPTWEHGGKPLGREFPATSIGWYRRTFSLAPEDHDRRIQLVFDGVYRDATVLLNGHYIAQNFSGYAPFVLDITDWVNTGAPNVLAVRVDATLGDGWFYEGAGIYRHVWLLKTAPVHLVEWGSFVRPAVDEPSIRRGTPALVALGSEVHNASDADRLVMVQWQLHDPAGVLVATAQSGRIVVPVDTTVLFEASATLPHPALWSIETPQLYRATVTVLAGDQPLDSDTVPFGVRSLRFDPDRGLFLNGRPVKVQGTCCHQDHAGVGTALPDRLQFYRIERLKSMGSNALRTSHNPPTPELMDATDRLGMLVLCETRMMDSSPEGLSQLERMVRRFRNHPSIFMWSLGNEEPEQGTERGQRIVAAMQRLAHRLDPTRLCTVAMNEKQGTGISYIVDVQGFNYSDDRTPGFHAKFPAKPVLGTETASTVCTRGIYANDKAAGYVSAYDLNKPGWGNTAEEWWSFYDSHEFLMGGFAWTGFDYRGEPTPYGLPCVSSHFGIMDTCGFPKDNYFYYKAWWGKDPVLHLFPHWNWPDKSGQPIAVWCHTNLDSVELFLNGRSLGARTVARNRHIEWSVPYEPGVLEARGSVAGKVVLTQRRETTGPPAKIVLHPDRPTLAADGEDLAVLAVEVQDDQGRTMPTALNDIRFEVTGARLLGLGNGDPSSHESDKADHRRVFNGWAQALVQASETPGVVTVRATSPGLESATLTLTATAAAPRPAVA